MSSILLSAILIFYICYVINFFRLDKRSVKNPEEDPVYLGQFSTDIDRVYSQGLIPVPVFNANGWVFRKNANHHNSLYRWCEEHSCQLIWDSVLWNKFTQRWEHNSIGGEHIMFILTPDPDVAFEANLTWS